MNVYQVYFKLYAVWFTLSIITTVCFWLTTHHFALTLLVKLATYFAVYGLIRFAKPYFYYFANLGYTPGKIMLKLFAADLAVSVILITLLDFIFHA